VKPAIYVPAGACACDVRDEGPACACDALDLPSETLLAISEAKLRGDRAAVDKLRRDGLAKLATSRRTNPHPNPTPKADTMNTNRESNAARTLERNRAIDYAGDDPAARAEAALRWDRDRAYRDAQAAAARARGGRR
jgi:hypothetical protein